ncbi:MAG: MFS transporter [Bacteroidota bacterium]
MINTLSSHKKYGLLLSLYLAQSIPMSFFSTVVPVIMRMENYSLASIGMLQMIKIPWILKFLWAPFIDRTSPTNHHYKRWIIASEVAYAAVIIAIGFFELSTDFSTIIVLMIGAFIISATQDIASDALAVKILASNQRSYGNSMQSAGSFLGTLIGSGVLLYLYTVLGWQNLLLALAGFVMLALIPLKYIRKDRTSVIIPKKRIGLKSISGFFRQPGAGRRVLFLSLIYSGLIGMLAMMKPFMVDAGYSVTKIAFIAGIFGTAFGAIGAIVGGHLLHFWGKKTAIRRIALYGSFAALFMLFMATANMPAWLIFPAVAFVWSAYALASTAVYTISMEMVREHTEGTDYSLQIIISHLSGILVAMGSGKLADMVGYSGLFAAEAALGVFVALATPWLYREVKGTNPPEGMKVPECPHHHRKKRNQEKKEEVPVVN